MSTPPARKPAATAPARAASPGRPKDLAKGAAILDAAKRMFTEHGFRSEEHTSELQSLMRISYAVFCLKKKKKKKTDNLQTTVNLYKNVNPIDATLSTTNHPHH